MTDQRSTSAGWVVASVGATAVVVIALVAPLVGPGGEAVIHRVYSFVCHQIPSRSPHIYGEAAALCHRCTGIAAGFALGLLLTPGLPRPLRRQIARGAQARWLLAAVLPTALDWALGVAGVWANTPTSRMLTGGVFGAAAGVILACNLLAATRSSRSSSLALTPDA